MTGDKSSDGNFLDEWKEARSTISRFDENLDGLRKYGFTVIAGLLAANAVQSYVNFNNPTKCGLIVITIAFIVGLYLLDIYYQRMVYAASIRAKNLETVLNIGLTKTICDRFQKENLSRFIRWIYIGFIVIAAIIGVIVVITAPSAQPTYLINSTTNTTSINLSSSSSVLANSTSPSTTLVSSITTTLVNSSNISAALINSSDISTTVQASNNKSTTLVNSLSRSITSVNLINQPDISHISEICLRTILNNIFSIIGVIFSIYVLYFTFASTSDNAEDDIFSKLYRIIHKFELIGLPIFVILLIISFIAFVYYLFPDLVSLEITHIFLWLFILSGGIGTFVIEYFSKNVNVNLKVKEYQKDRSNGTFLDCVEWIIDRSSIKIGEKVRIVIINLSMDKFKIHKDCALCEIIAENELWSTYLPEEKLCSCSSKEKLSSSFFSGYGYDKVYLPYLPRNRSSSVI